MKKIILVLIIGVFVTSLSTGCQEQIILPEETSIPQQAGLDATGGTKNDPVDDSDID